MSDAIDLKHFTDVTFGDRALQREILGLFDAQVSKLAETIRTASAEARREAAHTLKGAARGVGAFGLGDAAEAIERDGSQAALDRMTQAVEAARAAAAKLLAQT